MKQLFQAAVVVSAVLFANPAYATESTAPAPAEGPQVLPPELQEAASIRAVADAEIAKADATDLFDNISDDGRPAVRHRASGLVCTAGDNLSLPLLVYPGSPRGDDISCGSYTQGITTTTYATRYGADTTAQEVIAASISAIHEHFQDVSPYTGETVSATHEEFPKPLTARFTAMFKGNKVFTRTSAVTVGDWIIAQRVTAPIEKADLADLVAEVNLATSLISLLPPRAE